jgi:hypothetical protein
VEDDLFPGGVTPVVLQHFRGEALPKLNVER